MVIYVREYPALHDHLDGISDLESVPETVSLWLEAVANAIRAEADQVHRRWLTGDEPLLQEKHRQLVAKAPILDELARGIRRRNGVASTKPMHWHC